MASPVSPPDSLSEPATEDTTATEREEGKFGLAGEWFDDGGNYENHSVEHSIIVGCYIMRVQFVIFIIKSEFVNSYHVPIHISMCSVIHLIWSVG